MPRLEKTASAAIAALVVAVAATVTSLASSPAPDDAPAATSAASGTAAPAADARRPSASSRTVLFLGRSPELKPRGGVARSYPCRAASSLHWTCQVRQGAVPVVPPGLTADVVVVVLVADDDAPRVTRVLDRLPPGPGGARLVLLGPPTAEGRTSRRTAELRRVAASHGATFVDPVAVGWYSDPTGAGPFVRAGQLSPAGRVRSAQRLAALLDDLVPA